MTTEQQVADLARLAQEAFDAGNPEQATTHIQEAIAILAEQAAVDATPLIDIIAYGDR